MRVDVGRKIGERGRGGGGGGGGGVGDGNLLVVLGI